MKMTREDFAYFILPALLWPIVFIVLRSRFVYAMLVAALCLAAFTLYGWILQTGVCLWLMRQLGRSSNR